MTLHRPALCICGRVRTCVVRVLGIGSFSMLAALRVRLRIATREVNEW